MYYPLLGSFGGLVCWYYFMRFVESQWYVWVSQINHIPMDVEAEKHLDWVTLQLRGTCNVKPSLFKTWLCGHLNYQIEHQYDLSYTLFSWSIYFCEVHILMNPMCLICQEKIEEAT